jgi:hypothetical protein
MDVCPSVRSPGRLLQIAWALATLEGVFTLQLPDDADMMFDLLQLYSKWLDGSSLRLDEQSETCILRQLTVIFEERMLSGSPLELHVRLAEQALALLQLVIDDKHTRFHTAWLDETMLLLVGLTDYLLSRSADGSAHTLHVPLGAKAMKTMMDCMVRSAALKSLPVWKKVYTLAPKWLWTPPPIEVWASASSALLDFLMRQLLGPTEGVAQLLLFDERATAPASSPFARPCELSVESTALAWFRIVVLPGDVNAIGVRFHSSPAAIHTRRQSAASSEQLAGMRWLARSSPPRPHIGLAPPLLFGRHFSETDARLGACHEFDVFPARVLAGWTAAPACTAARIQHRDAACRHRQVQPIPFQCAWLGWRSAESAAISLPTRACAFGFTATAAVSTASLCRHGDVLQNFTATWCPWAATTTHTVRLTSCNAKSKSMPAAPSAVLPHISGHGRWGLSSSRNPCRTVAGSTAAGTLPMETRSLRSWRRRFSRLLRCRCRRT